MRDANAYITWPNDVTPPSDSTDSSRAMLGYVSLFDICICVTYATIETFHFQTASIIMI